jgi:hypothetical protein
MLNLLLRDCYTQYKSGGNLETLEHQHGKERQCSENSSQNKKLPDSNEILPLKDKFESPTNERLLTVPSKKNSLENVVNKEIRFSFFK